MSVILIVILIVVLALVAYNVVRFGTLFRPAVFEKVPGELCGLKVVGPLGWRVIQNQWEYSHSVYGPKAGRVFLPPLWKGDEEGKGSFRLYNQSKRPIVVRWGLQQNYVHRPKDGPSVTLQSRESLVMEKDASPPWGLVFWVVA